MRAWIAGAAMLCCAMPVAAQKGMDELLEQIQNHVDVNVVVQRGSRAVQHVGPDGFAGALIILRPLPGVASA